MESSEFKPDIVVARRQALIRGYVVGLAALLGVGIGFGLSDPHTPLWIVSLGVLGAAGLVVSSIFTKRV